MLSRRCYLTCFKNQEQRKHVGCRRPLIMFLSCSCMAWKLRPRGIISLCFGISLTSNPTRRHDKDSHHCDQPSTATDVPNAMVWSASSRRSAMLIGLSQFRTWDEGMLGGDPASATSPMMSPTTGTRIPWFLDSYSRNVITFPPFFFLIKLCGLTIVDCKLSY